MGRCLVMLSGNADTSELDHADDPRGHSKTRSLGERTCVINLGTELPVVDEAARSVMNDDCHDLVFDLTLLRRYETFALVRLAREWTGWPRGLRDPRGGARGARRRGSQGSWAVSAGSCTRRPPTLCARCSSRPSTDAFAPL